MQCANHGSDLFSGKLKAKSSEKKGSSVAVSSRNLYRGVVNNIVTLFNRGGFAYISSLRKRKKKKEKRIYFITFVVYSIFSDNSNNSWRGLNGLESV